MTTEEHDDNIWLEALAGRPAKDIDPFILAQANAVRGALATRRDAIEAYMAQPDRKRLEYLRQRLQREGLLIPDKIAPPGMGWQSPAMAVRYRQAKNNRPDNEELEHVDADDYEIPEFLRKKTGEVNQPKAWQRMLTGLGFGGSGASGSSTLVATRWAVLAFAVGAVFVALRLGIPGSGQDPAMDVLRGGTATVLIVPDPQVRLTELRTGLLAVKAVFTDKALPDGRVQIDIQASETALEYLQSQRITPKVKDGSVRIVIQK